MTKRRKIELLKHVDYTPLKLGPLAKAQGKCSGVSKFGRMVFTAFVLCVVMSCEAGRAGDIQELRSQFTEMPMEARRLTGPLFWLHGTESRERLEEYIEKIAEGHNGSFCAESRPHSDWLGPKWYEDLEICLEAAKKHNLKMWIFDEKWWPSQTVDGKVPEQYCAKRLHAEAVTVEGPKSFTESGYDGKHFVAAIAGKEVGEAVDGSTLVELSGQIRNGTLTWNVPAGKWKIMKFTWKNSPKSKQSYWHHKDGWYTLDGASADSVDWFINTVYAPHYERFKEDFGETIVGYFYDEPETQGDWGTEMAGMFAERRVDWKKAFVAWKFELAGDEQAAAKYAYIDTFFETWGRTMYGGMTRWCEERGVESIGHFMEHDGLYLDHGLGAGNLMQMQKYSSMGGMDLVVRQLYPGERKSCYYMPKLTSSISHVYNKRDHLAMCEIFGGYGQKLTYMQMKWLTDHHQVRGVNFMVTHSFNPKSPNDRDYPPYFYNSGEEPRWPLYRVWADYNNRLSLLLTGGRHVCPVALLFCGNSKHVGRVITPEKITGVLQDSLFDVDWLAYDVFEDDVTISGKELCLYDERYKILIVPPVEVIPYATLLKVKQFFEAGGVVVGYDFLPSRSATLGRTSKEIVSLRDAIWKPSKPSFSVSQTSPAGGRSYFLPDSLSPDKIKEVFTEDAGIRPSLEVLECSASEKSSAKSKEDWRWLHVLHRVKNGCDIFFICNQYTDGGTRRYKMRATAKGAPERWDAMRNEITAMDFQRTGPETVEFELALEPYESAFVVFHAEETATNLRPRFDASAKPVREPIQVLQEKCEIPHDVKLSKYLVYLEMKGLSRSAASVRVNGTCAGGMLGKPFRLEVTRLLKNGVNTIEVVPDTPKLLRLIFYDK